MTDQLVPTQRTVVTLPLYARAVLRSWHLVGEGLPSKAAIAVLYSQYMIETGGRDSWGWNVGNSKEVPGDGIDYHALRGVWEGVSPAEAARLIASGQAMADPSASHAAAVGKNRVSVIFNPPHPATWFSSFTSLDAAMEYHLKFLALKRYASAWPAVLAGDYLAFAHALKAKGYFTADAGAYARGMRPAFDTFMKSTAYETERAELDGSEVPTAGLIDGSLVQLEHDGIAWEVCPVYVTPIGIGEAVALAADLGYELPSPSLVDAIWRAADMRINGWDIAGAAAGHDGTAATMDSEATHAKVQAKVASLINKPYRLLAGAFKDVVIRDGEVGLYGWHDATGKPIQGFYAKHAPGWRDYSQGLRLVRKA